MLTAIEVSLPPMIADLDLVVDAPLIADLEVVMTAINALGNAHGKDLEALSVLLLRTESVASSKIESVEASLDDYARALHGIRSNPSAVSMVAATDALDLMIGSIGVHGRVDLASILAAHAALMRDDLAEARFAGRLRDMQNWIGGSDYSPRGAMYVPPPPETVPAYMSDLLAFTNRDDLPALVQAALAHAQFESIHPFTDGNGRIGRALINTVLRRRGATTSVVVPLASALVAHRDRYFDLLGSYRAGDIRPLIEGFAVASRVAAEQAQVTAVRLAAVPQSWRETLGVVRRGSAVAKLLQLLPSQPIVSVEQACELVDSPVSSVYAAIDRLTAVGVLRPLTERKRNQVWGASSVLDELDDLSVRIADAAR